MKHILTCSFGKDSIATALLALQHGEPLDELVYSEVMFSDTVSGELPEHKRFIYETAIPYFEKRGIPTRVLRGQKTYLDCFYRIVSRGNAEGKLASFPLTGRCSIQRDCKLPPIRTYQKTLPQDTVYYLGIAADEPIRLARLKPNQTSLLAKYNLTEKDAWAMCQAEGLLSPLYAFTGAAAAGSAPMRPCGNFGTFTMPTPIYGSCCWNCRTPPIRQQNGSTAAIRCTIWIYGSAWKANN